MAFPIEHWGIDWNPDNASEYLLGYYEQEVADYFIFAFIILIFAIENSF